MLKAPEQLHMVSEESKEEESANVSFSEVARQRDEEDGSNIILETDKIDSQRSVSA